MTPQEYIQLKAFARVDGARLALLWVSSFACYVAGLTSPLLGAVALVMMAATPFVVGLCVVRFRDGVRGGVISLMRGWGYSVYMFFYAAVLLALAQYAYFAFMDHGYIMQTLGQALEQPEVKQALAPTGLGQALADSLAQLGSMRPIDYALNVLTMNIMTGIVVGLPIAALTQRSTTSQGKIGNNNSKQ